MSISSVEERKVLEAEFHNQRAVDRKEMSEEEFLRKYSNKKFYSITRKSMDFLDNWLKEHCRDKKVLDYCCGSGGSSIKMAKFGGHVTGIDISSEEIESCKLRAESEGVAERTEFHVMDAENLTLEPNSFDVIICSGVLHHLDIEKAYPELARVLKKDGKIICIEALGYNPIINLYRKLTPKLRTAWETDHILKLSEVKKAKPFLDKVDIKFFYLFTILAVPFRNTPIFKSVLKLLEMIDSIVLKIPGINLMAWQMIFILSEPKEVK